MRERTRLTTELCLYSTLLDLRKAGRIEEVRPGRWRVKPLSLKVAKQLSATYRESALIA